jgi:hypothetical protein
MPVFFNGQEIITPAVNTAVDDSAMLNPNQNVGDTLALVGPCTQGAPNIPLSFGSAPDALAALGSGDLVDAITRAFDPSSDVAGPATIIAVRVNPAVQSSLVLKDASNASVITLTSTGYGQYTNQIKAKVEAASVQGLKLTTELGTTYYSQDNIYRAPFSIQYSGGQASATMSVNNSTVTLSAPAGTPVATIPLATYPTVQQLVDYINTVSGFSASVLSGLGASATVNALDNLTNQDVKTALFSATATLQAVVDYLNGLAEGFVNAVRTAGAGTLPAILPFTYLSGGSDGTITNTNWANAFQVLQTQDVQWITPCTGSQSIVAMADAHVVYCSTALHSRRRCIAGEALGTTDAQAISDAANLNSARTSLVHIGGYDYNAAGVVTLYAPFIVAAMIAGGFAGVSPGTPTTNKSLKLLGLERLLCVPTDTDPLIVGGVLCVAKTKTGYRVVQSITTWLTDSKFDKVEQSTGAALDYGITAVEDAIAVVKGTVNGPGSLGQAVSIADTTLRGLSVPAPNGPGVFVGDANNPPFKNVTASVSGDVIAVRFQASPGIPANYVNITVYAVPYSGTLAATQPS